MTPASGSGPTTNVRLPSWAASASRTSAAVDVGGLEDAGSDAVVRAGRRGGGEARVVGVEHGARLDEQHGERLEQLVQRRALEHEVAEALVHDARAAQGVEWRCAASTCARSSARDWACMTATAARSPNVEAISASSAVKTCGPAMSSRKITPMTSSWKIIGTAMIAWIFQKRTVDLMMRGSWCALSTITGRFVRSSSRTRRSDGPPTRERLMSASRVGSPA